MESNVWSLSLPAPIFWGVLAAWIPIPPSVMAGVLIAAVVYALLNHLLSLRDAVAQPSRLCVHYAQPRRLCYETAKLLADYRP